jgi:hypothetical protein
MGELMGLSTKITLATACVALMLTACAKKMDDPYAPSPYAPATEPTNEGTRSAPAEAEVEAEVEEVEAEEYKADEPAPDSERIMEDTPRRTGEMPQRSRPPADSKDETAPTGCPDETCMKVCKAYTGAKNTACIVAYNRGCFSGQANPLDCGEFGTTAEGKKEEKDSNIGIMPIPKL